MASLGPAELSTKVYSLSSFLYLLQKSTWRVWIQSCFSVSFLLGCYKYLPSSALFRTDGQLPVIFLPQIVLVKNSNMMINYTARETAPQTCRVRSHSQGSLLPGVVQHSSFPWLPQVGLLHCALWVTMWGFEIFPTKYFLEKDNDQGQATFLLVCIICCLDISGIFNVP